MFSGKLLEHSFDETRKIYSYYCRFAVIGLGRLCALGAGAGLDGEVQVQQEAESPE